MSYQIKLFVFFSLMFENSYDTGSPLGENPVLPKIIGKVKRILSGKFLGCCRVIEKSDESMSRPR